MRSFHPLVQATRSTYCVCPSVCLSVCPLFSGFPEKFPIGARLRATIGEESLILICSLSQLELACERLASDNWGRDLVFFGARFPNWSSLASDNWEREFSFLWRSLSQLELACERQLGKGVIYEVS